MSNIIGGKQDPLPRDLLSRNYHKWAVVATVGFVAAQSLLVLNGFNSRTESAAYPFSNTARDINIFIAGAFVICCLLQVTRLLVTGQSGYFIEQHLLIYSMINSIFDVKPRPWDNKASLSMCFVENFIAAFSTLTTLTGNWGGVCIDSYGIRTAAETWPEWLVSVPTLAFILISVDIKSDYDSDDYAILFFNTACVVWGALMQVCRALWWNHLCYFMALFTFALAMYFIMKTVWKLQAIVDAPTAMTDVNGLEKYKKLIASRRITLSYFLITTELLFPVLYTLCRFGVISDDVLFSALVISSALAKIMFAALVTDAHMEVSHPSITQLAEEKKSHEARRAFLRYVFHEVRVPLNSISMGVQLLGDSDIDPDSPEGEVIAMMREATTFMGETLNDVLAIQKIEEGALQLIFKPFLLQGLLSISMAPFEMLARDKGIKIITDIEAGIPTCVEGDKYRLKHVLSNLISNGVKFTKHGSTLKISVRAGNPYSIEGPSSDKLVTVRKYSISVTDQGRGLTPEEVRNIFVPFLVTKPGELQQGRGTGVGLAICKEILNKHGGTILCESLVGAGSTFTIELPMAVCDDTGLSSYSAISADLADKMAELKVAPALGEAPTGKHGVVFEETSDEQEPAAAPAAASTAAPAAAPSTASVDPPAGAGADRDPLKSTAIEGIATAVATAAAAGTGEVAAPAPAAASVSPAAAPVAELSAQGSEAAGKGAQALATATAAGEAESDATRKQATVAAGRKPKAASTSTYDFQVLVTDDVASNRKLLSLLLKKKGIEPRQAEDGSQAVELVKSLPPNTLDVIFMDNTMPVMTGIEATKKLRKIGYENMIIGLTGNSMEEELVEFATMGADLVLTKPMRPHALELLLEYFTVNGVKSKDHQKEGLFMDSEKVMWVPKRHRAGSASRSRERKEKDMVLFDK